MIKEDNDNGGRKRSSGPLCNPVLEWFVHESMMIS